MEGNREMKVEDNINNIKELGKHLDPHISLEIYDFYSQQYPENKELIQKEKLNILLKTLMHEKTKELLDILKITDQNIIDLLNQQVKTCNDSFEALKNKLNIIENEDINICLEKGALKESKDYGNLSLYSKWLYERGKYEDSLKLIKFILKENKNPPINILWGEIASLILLKKGDEAFSRLNSILEVIKKSKSSSQEEMSKIWYINWLVFTIFKLNSNSEKLLNLILSPMLINTTQNYCSHLIKYIIVCFLINGNISYKHKIQELVAEDYNKSNDPICLFMRNLFFQNHSNNIKNQIQAIHKIIQSDFYLKPLESQIKKSLYEQVIKLHSRVFNVINVVNLGEILGIPKEEAIQELNLFLSKKNLLIKNENELYFLKNEFDENLNIKLDKEIQEIIQKEKELKSLITPN